MEEFQPGTLKKTKFEYLTELFEYAIFRNFGKSDFRRETKRSEEYLNTCLQVENSP